MSSIKFTYRFSKMPHDTHSTWLVGVSVADISQLPSPFIAWDTTHPGGHFSLAPAGPHILLTLFTLHEDAIFSRAWTTIRTWDAEKEKYYKNMIGRRVNIESPPAPPSSPGAAVPPKKNTVEWYNDASLWCHCPKCGNPYYTKKVCPQCGTDTLPGIARAAP